MSRRYTVFKGRAGNVECYRSVTAGVAELEFASALGADGRKPVGVRIPPPAPQRSIGMAFTRAPAVAWFVNGPCNWGER